MESGSLWSLRKMQKSLAEAALIAYPAPGAPLALFLDASNFAIGAVLQQHVSGGWQPTITCILTYSSFRSSIIQVWARTHIVIVGPYLYHRDRLFPHFYMTDNGYLLEPEPTLTLISFLLLWIWRRAMYINTVAHKEVCLSFKFTSLHQFQFRNHL